MKNVILVLSLILIVIACELPSVELKPVKKKTDCLLKEMTKLSGIKPNWFIETHKFSYDGEGNPTSWTIFDEKGVIKWTLSIEYKNNRINKVTQSEPINTSPTIQSRAYKTYEINESFTKILVRSYNLDNRGKVSFILDPTFMNFKRNKNDEIKFEISNYVSKNDTSLRVGDAAAYFYDKQPFYVPNYFTISDNDNVTEKWEVIDRRTFQTVKTISKGFWKNVNNPFNANIWLSLIANYYKNWGIEGGDWSKNMPTFEPDANAISTFDTNVEGFPCRLNTPDQSLTVSYLYENCNCK